MACRMLLQWLPSFLFRIMLNAATATADQIPFSCRLKCIPMPICHAKYVIDCFA